MNPKCQREDCKRAAAKGDDFCSRYCLERHNGKIQPTPRSQRERLKKMRDEFGPTVEVANPDAMSYRAPGSFEAGKRR